MYRNTACRLEAPGLGAFKPRARLMTGSRSSHLTSLQAKASSETCA